MQIKSYNRDSKKITAQMATKTLVTLAVLTALGIVCSMPFPTGLTLRIGNDLKFSFSFIVIALAARKYGAFEAAIVAGLSDLIQTFVAGYGVPNPLISASAILSGVIFGLLLHKNVSTSRIIIAITLQSVICSMILTTSALVLMYGVPLFPLLWWRLLQAAIMAILEFITMHLIFVKTDVLRRIKFIDLQ